MCVALPGQVEAIVDPEHGIVRVRTGDKTHDMSAALIMDQGLEVGDWVEIHMGHALAKISQEEAQDLLAFIAELDAAHRRALEQVPIDEDPPT